MKKDYICWSIASVVVMLLFPWLAVTFVKGDAAMAVCFLLFYAIDPVYAVIAGIFAGSGKKRLWILPAIPAALFLTGTWRFFDMGEPAFIRYAVCYLLLGVLAMLLSMCICRKARR